MKTCDVCSKQFNQVSRKRYCSIKCAKYAKTHTLKLTCYSCKKEFNSVNEQIMCYTCRQQFGKELTDWIEQKVSEHFTIQELIKSSKIKKQFKYPRLFESINYDDISKVQINTVINDNYNTIVNLISCLNNYQNISIGITTDNRIRLTDNTYKYKNNTLRYQISINWFIQQYI